MENNNSIFYTANEVKEILGISRTRAYALVKELNSELASRGFIVITGKIPKKYFEEKIYGLAS